MAKKKRKKERRLPILLLEDINNLGQRGEVVLVKPGYFRYLILNQKAVLASKEKLEKELKPLLLKEKIRSREELAKKLKDELEKLVLEFKYNPFSPISKEKILKALKEKNFNFSKSQIELEKKIKESGEYQISVNLGYNLKAFLKIKVKK